jgi:hypothetical protein
MRELIGKLPVGVALTPQGRRHLQLYRKAQLVIYLKAYLAISGVPSDKLDEATELCMDEIEALVEDYEKGFEE